MTILTPGKLPNLRRMIIPDRGMTIIDMDLARADAQIVAADSNAEGLKARFRLEALDPTRDLHTQNAIDLFGGKSDKKHRDLAKKIVHASHYLVSPRSLAQQAGILVGEAERFISGWFRLNPEIPAWHDKIKLQVQTNREVKNVFGYRKFIFGRIEDSLPEAVAWIPQSTVALVINHALCNIAERIDFIQVLLQVHDSLVTQTPTERLHEAIALQEQASLITIPYPDPLIIPVGFKTSETSWGDVKDYKRP